MVEFALVLPLLLAVMYGIMAYGQYFLIAHSVQQLANDAARSTVAGLSAAERSTLANATVGAEFAALRTMTGAQVTTAVDETSDTVTVRVRLDASAMPLIRNALVPMPAAVIERRAVIRPGGIA